MPSSIRPALEDGQRLRAAPDEVTIDDWPLRDRPLASAAVMTLTAAAAWLAAWTTGSAAAAATVAMLLIVTLWRTWLPIGYHLGPGGVQQSAIGLRWRIPWTAIRQFELYQDGVLLLPDAAAAPLSPLRGLFLPWGAQRRAVMSQLHYHFVGRSRLGSRSTHGAALSVELPGSRQ